MKIEEAKKLVGGRAESVVWRLFYKGFESVHRIIERGFGICCNRSKFAGIARLYSTAVKPGVLLFDVVPDSTSTSVASALEPIWRCRLERRFERREETQQRQDNCEGN